MRHITSDTRHVTCVTWPMGGVNIPSSGLGLIRFWRFGGKGWLYELITLWHNTFECVSSKVPLPSLFRQLARLQSYDLRQSTSTQFITSCMEDRPRTRLDQPCPALPLLWDIAGHCRPRPDGGNYYCYYHHHYYYYIYYYHWCRLALRVKDFLHIWQ